MKPSQLKRWVERHEEEILNEASLKVPLGIEVEIYLGRHLDKKCYFVIRTDSRFILRQYIKDNPRPSWFALTDYPWIKNLENTVKSLCV